MSERREPIAEVIVGLPPEGDPVPVDLLVRHVDYLITMDAKRRIFRDGALAVRGGRIVAVGKTSALEPRVVPEVILEGAGKVGTPGLVDGHIHTAFHLSRGLADEVGAQRFLFERMYPYEGLLDAEENYWSALLAVYELLSHGVTTFVDPGNYHPEATAQAAGEAGVRAVVAKSTMDLARSPFGQLPPAFQETTEEGLLRSRQVVEKLHGAYHGRIRASFSFRGVNNCSDALLTRMKEEARRYGVPMQAHACFAKETRDASLLVHQQTEVERLHTLGVLGPDVLLVHMGWATAQELFLLRDHDVKVVAAPSSSLHNAYGNILMGHIPELLDMGVTVGIGSDHASSGIVDLVTEMFLLAGGYKEVRLDPEVLPPETVLEMATLHGARLAGFADEVGSLEPGKSADLVLFDAETPEWQPLYNPISNLVYSASGATVHTVLASGKVVVEEGRVRTLPLPDILREIRRRQDHILAKTGLLGKVGPTWPIL